MASKKIIWSHRAKIKLYEILEFYIDRNKSKTYSVKLNKQFNRGLRLLSKYPNMGLKTDLEGIRGLIIDNFILFFITADRHKGGTSASLLGLKR